MAYILERKAKALLMTGHSVKETAEACGVPKQTVSRWKHKDLPEFLRPIVADSPELQAMAHWGRRLRQARMKQNGTKKEALIVTMRVPRHHEGSGVPVHEVATHP